MSDYSERRTVVEDAPIRRARPVVATQYDSVVHEERGMSGGAIAALVLAAIAATVVIVMLIMNSQQRNSDDQLAQERARTAAAQQASAQQPVQSVQPTQQPQVVVVPSSPMPAVTAPVTPPPVTETAPSSAQVELDVTSKLLEDGELRAYPIDVKVTGHTAILSGQVSSDELKTRAEQLARSVKGVGKVINTITVQS